MKSRKWLRRASFAGAGVFILLAALIVAITGVYTFSGGLSAVVMTDVVQLVVMFVGGAALLVLSLTGEAAQDGNVEWGVELANRFAVHAEPFCGVVGAAAIEPFGDFQPGAEFAGVFVNAKVL